MSLRVAAPQRGTDRRAQEQQRACAGALQRRHRPPSERSHRLAAADGDGMGEIPDACAHGPVEVEVGRPAFGPQRHGALDGEAEGPEPRPLLLERIGPVEAGGRFEDHELAASHALRDRVVPAGRAGEDDQVRCLPARERPREAGAGLGEHAGCTDGRRAPRRASEGAAQGNRRQGPQETSPGQAHA